MKKGNYLFTNREPEARSYQGYYTLMSKKSVLESVLKPAITQQCYVQTQSKEWGLPRAHRHDVMRQAGKPGLLVSCFAAYTDLLVLSLRFSVYLFLCL